MRGIRDLSDDDLRGWISEILRKPRKSALDRKDFAKLAAEFQRRFSLEDWNEALWWWRSHS